MTLSGLIPVLATATWAAGAIAHAWWCSNKLTPAPWYGRVQQMMEWFGEGNVRAVLTLLSILWPITWPVMGWQVRKARIRER